MYIIYYIIVHHWGMDMAKANYDFPEGMLTKVRKLSKAKTKRQAIIVAMEEYIRRKKIERLIASQGKIPLCWTRASLRKFRG